MSHEIISSELNKPNHAIEIELCMLLPQNTNIEPYSISKRIQKYNVERKKMYCSLMSME